MRVVLTRVKEASVEVGSQEIAQIPGGYLLLVGLTHTDDLAATQKMAEKIAHLRVMEDENGKLNKTIQETDGQVLAVPQFTLYADTSGRRPGFKEAARPEQASQLFDSFVAQLIAQGLVVKSGQFGAYMIVTSENDGPLTLILEA